MALLTRSELKTLTEMRTEPFVSIYMPAQIAGPEIRQNSIRLKNHLSEAREQLVDAGWRDADAEKLLQPAYDLLEQTDFWRHQQEGLSLFIAPDFFRYYRLPLEFEEMTVVSDRAHLKPIMPLLSGDGYFYLLAFSQNQVQLFRGTRHSISEVNVEEMPASLADALRYDDPEEQLNFHNVSGSGSVPIYHGQGVGTTDNKEDIRRFCNKLDHELRSFLADEEAPLVLASVQYLMPIYQSVNSYPHLLDRGVVGNPEAGKLEELHQEAWNIVQPHFQRSQQEARELYNELVGTGKATSDLQTVIPAAYNHRVDTLFVSLEDHQWGRFDPQTQQVELHEEAQPEDTDLLDSAAVETFVSGGKVYVVPKEETPEAKPIAAVFRYVA